MHVFLPLSATVPSSKQDNNCNKPGHHHPTTTLRPSKRPTVSYTTKKTTVYSPTSTTFRPTSSKRPHMRPTTSATTTQRPTQTYPPRPTSTPNPTGSGSGSGNLGVQPPSTLPPSTPNPNVFMPGSQPPFFIIPFPFPFAPTCPCYQIEPTGNYSSQNQLQLPWQQQQQQPQQQQQHQQTNQFQWQSQHQFAIGFIPVLFVPHCFNGNHSNQVSGQYLQVPYPCSQCNQSNRDGRELDLNENYSSSDSFKQVLAQAGVDMFSNSLVKSPHRKRSRKFKRVQGVEDVHMNEQSVVRQEAPKEREE
jgi:hypothetical protein